MRNFLHFARKNEIWFTTFLILIIGGISYLPYIHNLGIFHDDWNLYLVPKIGSSFLQYYQSDRPGLGFVYDLLVPLMGFKPITYQIFNFALRFISTLAFLWLMRLIFPNKKLETTLMSVLFFVFPGFVEQSNAFTYQNHFLVLSISILSLVFTIKSLMAKRILSKLSFLSLAVIFEVIYPLIIEYFIGLEMVRVILIFFILKKNEPQKSFKQLAIKTLQCEIPYFIVTILFLIWRFVGYDSTRGATDANSIIYSYVQSPILNIGKFIIRWARSLLDTVFSVWFVPLYESWKQIQSLFLMEAIILALFSAGMSIVFIFSLEQSDTKESEKGDSSFGKNAIILGFLIVAFTIIPITLFNRYVSLSSNFDRYTIPALIGVVMIIVGFLDYIHSNRVLWRISIAFVIFISVLTQSNNLFYARDYWQVQKDFWWQLSWRAPQLDNGTVIIPLLANGYAFMDVKEIITPENVIYYPENNNISVTAEILNDQTAGTILRGMTYEIQRRELLYVEDLSKALILSMPKIHGCLHALDSNQIEIPQDAQALISVVASKSNINQILVDVAGHNPPEYIFGTEPEHTWCYFYQKASLARQKRDWAQVVDLADEAYSRGLHPNDPVEWMPFLEGYANLGRQQDVEEILTVIKSFPDIQYQLCNELNSHPVGVYSTGQPYETIVSGICGR